MKRQGTISRLTALILRRVGESNSVTVQTPTSLAGSYTLTLPPNDGDSGQFLQTNGSGTTSWATAGGGSESVSTQTNTDYTILDGDGFTTVLFSTGNTDRTATLPTAADNTNRRIRIQKIDTGTGKVTIDGEGAETINGIASVQIFQQWDAVVLQCTGSAWVIISTEFAGWESYTPTLGNVTEGSGATKTFKHRRVGDSIEIRGQFTFGTGGSWSARISVPLPTGLTIDTNKTAGGTNTAKNFFGQGIAYDNSANINYPGYISYESSTAIRIKPDDGSDNDWGQDGTFPMTAAVNDYFTLIYTIPITEYNLG